MPNLIYPGHRPIAESLEAFYTERHDAVIERLAYPDPDASFTVFLHNEMNDVPIVLGEEAGGLSITWYDRSATKLSRTLEHTLDEIFASGLDIGNTGELEGPERDLQIVNYHFNRFRKDNPGFQLQSIGIFGLLGAANKPSQERVRPVLRGTDPENTPEDVAFRRAMDILQRLTPTDKELQWLEQHKAKAEADLRDSHNVATAARRLNRLYQTRFIQKIVERILDERTLGRDVLDDITMTWRMGDLPDPVRFRAAEVEQAPVIRVPWELLAPGGSGEPRNLSGEPSSPSEPAATSPQEAGAQHTTLRTDWIGSLALGWRYGGKTVEVDLPTGNPDQPYRGAELNDRHGKPFVVIADADEPGNAMYYADRRSAHSLRAAVPIPPLEVFNGLKFEARARGARRIYHTGEGNFYVGVLELLNELEERNSWGRGRGRRRGR